jgi:glucan 1,3-beta-glucosidase
VVYFPPGTYVISKPIIDYYYTQIIGNPNCLPVIKPSAEFSSSYVIDANPYQPTGNTAWGSTNVFWRQIRNLVLDLTSIPATTGVAGIHWPTGQATSLSNIQFKLSSAAGTQHVGIFIESGSGGFMGDLTFTGGLNGLQVGNQQFTMRNLKFDGCMTAINQLWDWGWTYKSLSINNCQVGISMGARNPGTGVLSVGSMVVVDSVFSNTPVGIATNRSSTDPTPVEGQAANSLILDNVKFNNVAQPVTGPGDVTVLSENSVNTWGQGHKYTPTGPEVFQGPFSSSGRAIEYVEKSKPQYEKISASGFLSARDAGARGDGKTDDTAALNAAVTKAASSGLILYLDHGDYLVTDVSCQLISYLSPR